MRPTGAGAAAVSLLLGLSAGCVPHVVPIGLELPPADVVARERALMLPPGVVEGASWLVDVDGSLLLWSGRDAWSVAPGGATRSIELARDVAGSGEPGPVRELAAALERMVPPEEETWRAWTRVGDDVYEVRWGRQAAGFHALARADALGYLGGLAFRLHAPATQGGRMAWEHFDGTVTTLVAGTRFASGYFFPFGRDGVCEVENPWSSTVGEDGVAIADVALRCDGRRVVVPSRFRRLRGPEVGFDGALHFLLAEREGEAWTWWSVSRP